MTDSAPQDEAPAAPPAAQGKQGGAKRRIEWTREHRLAFWSNMASFASVGFAAFAFAILVLTLHATQDNLAVAHRSADESRRQADAALVQASIAQRALVASERPWLSVGLINNGPVSFDDRGAHVELVWTVRNHGRIPAQEVNILSEVYPMSSGRADYSDFLLVQQKRFCDGSLQIPLGMSPNRETVFPGEDFIRGVSVVIRPELLNDARAYIAPRTATLIAIVGCVTYTFPGSDRWHMTGFAYTLYRRDPQEASHLLPIPITGEVVPPDDLRVTNSLWGMGPAD